MAQQVVEILSLNIDNDALITKLSQTKAEIDKLSASQKELQKAGQGSSKEFVEQEAQLKTLRTSYSQQIKLVQQITDAEKKQADANKAVNDALKEEITSINQATANNTKLRAIRNELNSTTKEGAAAIEAINKKMDENTNFIKANASAAEKQKMNIGNYTESIKEAWNSLSPFNGGLQGFAERSREAGGAGNLLKSSFSQLATGIGGATKAALTFIVTPIGAVIAGITAAFAAGKAIFDYNQGLQEANKELKALGVNAKDLSIVRSEITATAETFDKEFSDIAAKANSLAKAYGISMSEANNIIAQGLAAGGAQNEEFLDSLGQYDALFAKAGYSAQEFVNIINQGYELGIYSDKLPDAIKEADLALKEQGKATRDALVNAFGASFTDDILKSIRTGEKTTAEALDAIAKKSKETALTQQQQAQLTADLFKSAGEDAGGSLKILEAVNQAANKELDETAKKQLELAEANERLNKAQAELFEVKGFGDIWTSIKIMGIDALSALLEGLSDIKKDMQPIIDIVGVLFVQAWANVKTAFGIFFNLIKGSFQILGNTIGTFFNVFKALLTGDFSGALDAVKNGFKNLLNIVGDVFGKIKNTIIDGIQTIIKNISPVLDALGVDVDKLNKKLDSMKSKTVEVKAKTSTTETTNRKVTADVDPNAAANAKKAADAQKKALDDQAKATDALIKKYKEELDLFIASQDFKKKSLQDQLALEKQILDKRLALNELEYSKGKKSKEAYETEKYNLTNTYLKKQADAVVANAQQELEDYKKSLQQKKQDDTFFTEEKLQAKIAENNALLVKELEFQLLRKEQGVINEQEYLDAVNAVNEANRLKNEEAQAQRDEAKKEQQAIDLENQMILDEEKFANDFELERERERLRYEAELKEAEKTGADLTKIKAKHANNDKKIEEAKESAVRQQYAQTFGNAAQLLGERTAAGRAASIAQATMNVYEGITQVWAADSVLPEPIATIAKVASTGVVLASGLGAVKKITSTQVPSRAGGGIIPKYSGQLIDGGSNLAIPLSNGDDTLVYVKQNEVVLNRQQQARAGGARFFRSIGVPGFAAGGYVGGNTNLGSMGGYKIDMDALAEKIGQQVGQANLLLPPPVTVLDDITTAQSNQSRIIEGASL